MDKERCKRIILPCSCKCCYLAIEKYLWKDGDVSYNISVLDSRYDHNVNTLRGRMKRIWAALFGKPVYYNDLYIENEDILRGLISDMADLLAWNGDQPDSEE